MPNFFPIGHSGGQFVDLEGAEWRFEDGRLQIEAGFGRVPFQVLWRTKTGRWLIGCEESDEFQMSVDHEISWFQAARLFIEWGYPLPEDLDRLVAKVASRGPNEATATRDRHTPPPDHHPSSPAGPRQHVTLDQAAALVNRTKRALEHYKRTMPKPRVLGGGGKPHLYTWSEMRPWLAKTFGTPDLPEVFPADRNAGRS